MYCNVLARASYRVFPVVLPRALLFTFALLVLVVLIAPPSLADAAGYVVNSLADDTTDDDFCVLREAILAANNSSANDNCGAASNADDTITFNVSGTITLGAQLPNIANAAITGALTLDGGGNITVSGNDAVRVFYVDVGGDLTLQNLTVTKANPSSGASGGGLFTQNARVTIANSVFSDNYASLSGGLWNADGRVSITNSAFSGNQAFLGAGLSNVGGDMTIVNSVFFENQGGGGGGIDNAGGTMTILNSTFSGNHSDFGGGLYNGNGKVTIVNSTFSDNEASGGGGVANAKTGRMTIRNSTFSNNLAFRGGALYNDKKGNLTVTNSTFTGNHANSIGGGLSNYKNSIATIINSTFSGNSADSGGGSFDNTENSTLTLKNTLVANSGNSVSCHGTLMPDSTNNLATDSTCGTSFKVVTPSQLNLGALTGIPAYLPLHSRSVAIDSGKNTVCAAPSVNNQSQNGVPRPQGGSGSGITRCDIGSYEAPNPCTTKPAPPRLKDPPDQAALPTTQPILKWKAARCAASYSVDVVDVAKNVIVHLSGNLFGQRYQTKPLATGRAYRWYVTACNDFGCAHSRGRTFILQP